MLPSPSHLDAPPLPIRAPLLSPRGHGAGRPRPFQRCTPSLLLLWPLGGAPLHPLSGGGGGGGSSSVVVVDPVGGGTPPSLSLLDVVQRPSLHYLLDPVPRAIGVALCLCQL